MGLIYHYTKIDLSRFGLCDGEYNSSGGVLKDNRLDLLLRNVFWIIIFIIVKIIYSFCTKKNIVINKDCIKKIIPFLLVAILPIIWYIVLSNHTVQHAFFVYRNMLIFLFGILICLDTVLTLEKQEK